NNLELEAQEVPFLVAREMRGCLRQAQDAQAGALDLAELHGLNRFCADQAFKPIAASCKQNPGSPGGRGNRPRANAQDCLAVRRAGSLHTSAVRRVGWLPSGQPGDALLELERFGLWLL